MTRHERASGSEQSSLEHHFQRFRTNTIGHDQQIQTPYGIKPMRYFDWTASGRLYAPIEDRIQNTFGPFVGNTHSESSETGMAMTAAYHEARQIIKDHVNANEQDILVMTGTGATGAVNKLQRVIGLKLEAQAENFAAFVKAPKPKQVFPFPEEFKPAVFVTHMEHHSNQTSWEETVADVVIVPPGENGAIDLETLRELNEEYRSRKIKIGAFTAASNVTGIKTPYHEMAKIMHENDGYCFVDFAAAAPYTEIDMHPEDPMEKLDAIYFSPHKFLGGPGTPGVLVFDKDLYPEDTSPDQPGGGTVLWTNPWGGHKYFDDIEVREDGGTPGFLQTMKTALAVKLKEEMGVEQIEQREKELLHTLMNGMEEIPEIKILDEENKDRLGIVSFHMENTHYNLVVKLLNDRFGIQARGGCSCAGTYGHCLFNIDEEHSKEITDDIDHGDQSKKPGWVRLSLHPTTRDSEVTELTGALKQIADNSAEWKDDYVYNSHTNEFTHKETNEATEKAKIAQWFVL